MRICNKLTIRRQALGKPLCHDMQSYSQMRCVDNAPKSLEASSGKCKYSSDDKWKCKFYFIVIPLNIFSQSKAAVTTKTTFLNLFSQSHELHRQVHPINLNSYAYRYTSMYIHTCICVYVFLFLTCMTKTRLPISINADDDDCDEYDRKWDWKWEWV